MVKLRKHYLGTGREGLILDALRGLRTKEEKKASHVRDQRGRVIPNVMKMPNYSAICSKDHAKSTGFSSSFNLTTSQEVNTRLIPSVDEETEA